MRAGPAVLLLAAALLVGCKPYDDKKMTAVCSGTGYESAAAYDPNAPVKHPYPLAMIYDSPHVGHWYVNTPARFQTATDAPSKANYREVSLAMCIEQKAGPFDRECQMNSFDSKFEFGDGPVKTDVKKSERGVVKVKAHGSHYVLTMREAKTGKVISTKELDVKVTHCPLVVLGNYPEDYVDISDDALVEFAASALPKPVVAKLLVPPPPPKF